MDMPIISPSKISYADEVEFNQLLEDLRNTKHNGFIRITSTGSDEGYILFKTGKQVAASYNEYAKSEAIKKILAAVTDDNTLIEIFNLRESPIDYLIGLNKPYLIESDRDIYDMIGKLKTAVENEETNNKGLKNKTLQINAKSGHVTDETTLKNETITENRSGKSFNSLENPNKEIFESQNIESESKINLVTTDPPNSELDEESLLQQSGNISSEKSEVTNNSPTSEMKESNEDSDHRSTLLKKYGIKEINEEEVDKILYSYNGEFLDNVNIENIELNLMNKIKKSILSMPTIRGAEVLVFLENNGEITGNVNVLIEYYSKGFFSRMKGEARDIENLRQQIINIVQIEIKKSFRKRPEIADNFNINVDIG